jgi:biopolymer transport protein ExbD
MAMNVPSAGGGEDDDAMGPIAEINVTPLVDVMLVLLIIFMVTAPLMLSKVPITLPKANLDEMGKPRDPLIVSIDLDNHFYLDTGQHSEEIPQDQLANRLRAIAKTQGDNLVYVRADKGVEYGKVLDLIGMVGNSGFYRVSLMSEAQQ